MYICNNVYISLYRDVVLSRISCINPITPTACPQVGRTNSTICVTRSTSDTNVGATGLNCSRPITTINITLSNFSSCILYICMELCSLSRDYMTQLCPAAAVASYSSMKESEHNDASCHVLG